MGEAFLARGGGGGGASIDSIINGDIAIYVPSRTSVQYPSTYWRSSVNFKQKAGEKRGLLCWRHAGSFGGLNQTTVAEVDWEAQTVTTVIKQSGATNTIYEYMFSSGQCYVAVCSGEDEEVPPAVYIPET